MIVGILKEPHNETRVSLLPEGVATLTKKDLTVLVEADAGARSSATNGDYEKAEAKIATAEEVIAGSEVILSIYPPDSQYQIPASKILIGVYQVLYNAPLLQQWAQQGLTVFSMEMLPRTTRAQSMDILSSQANIAGYKSVLLAANLYPRKKISTVH